MTEIPPAETPHERSNKILAHLIAGLPPKHRSALEVLNRVNEVYVTCGRDTVVRDTFDEYLAFTAANQRYGREGKGQAFYITGESGAGKTDVVEHLLVNHPSMQPVQLEMGMFSPWVSVSLEGPATLANLGNTILAAAGYRSRRTLRQSAVWPMLPEELLSRGVALIHIDETQHLLANKSETQALLKSLKGLMNSKSWPLRIVLSGMPETNEMISSDAQGERRSFSVPLPSIVVEEELFLVEKIIRKLCEAAQLDYRGIIESDMPKRIAHAAAYQFGRVCEVVAAGIYSAILDHSTRPEPAEVMSLESDHLARAYLLHSHARGVDGMNPFLSDDWDKLHPGYFIVDRMVYGQ